MDIFYFSGFIAICLLSSHIGISIRKNLYAWSFVIISLFLLLVVFRSIDGTADTYAYVDHYNNISLNKLYTVEEVDRVHQFEYGYTLLAQIIKFFIGDNTRLFFAIIAIFQTILIYFGTKNFLKVYNGGAKSNYLLFIPFFTLYVAIFGFMYNAIVLRAGIAIAMIYFATSLFISKKRLWGLIIFGVSLFMHRSAFIGLFILVLFHLNVNLGKRSYFILLSTFFLFYLFRVQNVISSIASNYFIASLSGQDNIASLKYTNYLGKTNESLSSYSLLIIFNFIISAIMVSYTDKRNSPLLHTLLRVNVFSICIMSLLSAIPAISRVFDYFFVYNILLFYLILVNRYDYKKGIIFSSIIVSYSIYFYRLAILH